MTIAGHELVGYRGKSLVGRLPAQELIDIWPKCVSRVIKRGFVVELADLEPPRTGIFDGLKIIIDPDVVFEMQCFVLLHLFGHSVQWVAPTLAARVEALATATDRPEFIKLLEIYEHEAGRFGLQLLHEAGIVHLDSWYSDFVATDWTYVKTFYSIGSIPPWDECLTRADHFIEPLPIPELSHRRVEVRYAF